MLNIKSEQRLIPKNGQLASDLTKHIASRITHGSIAVIADKPVKLLESINEEWGKYAPALPTKRFGAQEPADDPCLDALFATVEQFVYWPPDCPTLYITCPITRLQLSMVTTWMPTNGLVVMYENPKQHSQTHTKELHEVTSR